VFGILEKDYNIPPVMTGKEMAECETLDELTLISYISQVYNAFKGEIPYFVRDKQQSSPADKELSGITTPITTSHRKTSSGSSSRPSVINKSSSKTNRVHQKRQSLDKHKHAGVELQKRSRQSSSGSNKRRSTDRTQAAQLYPYQEQRKSSALALSKRKLSPLGPKLQTNSAQFQDRCKFLEDKIRHDFGMITREERQTIEDEAWKKKKPPMPISKLEREQWNIKMLEDKLKILKDGKLTEREKQYAIDGSRLTQEVFNHKFQSMDAKLKSGGRDIEGEKRYDKFDSRLKALDKKLKVGPNLDVGVRGSNKVSLMASQLSRSAPDSQPPLSPLSKSASSKSVYLGLGVHGSEVCYFCKERVYLMERMSAEGMFFHRGCFKCEYCGTALRLGGYAFDRNVPFGGKFYCQTHYGMQRVERPVYTRHVINKASTGGSTPDLSSRNNKNAKSPGRRISGPRDSSLTAAILAEEQKSRLNVASTRVSSGEIDSRGLTPERAEFENSYADMTSEDELSELDEDEWTERNFGSSVEQDTSDDEYSDLSTDTESDESLEEEVERSMTVDETRRLAERWKRRYSQETLVDVSGATDESDTETDTGGESDVFSSEEEYRQSKHTAENNGRPQETECQFDNRRNVDGEMSDSLHSDDYTTYTDTETEEEQPVVRHEIPEIVIEEMLSKPLNSDEEHLVPEAVEAFQAANKSFDVSPQEVPEVSSVENGNVKEICVRVRSPVSPTDQSDINKSIAEIDDVVKDLIRQSDAYKENIESIKSKETSSTLTSVPEDSFGNRLPIGREADIGSGVEKNVPEDGSNRFKPPNHERSRLGLAKSKCRDDERRHTSPVSLRDITRAKEEFLNCGGSDLKKRSSSPVKKDALFKTLKSIEQLQRVLESPPSQDQISASRESLDRLKRTERSLSPPVKRQPLSLFNSRFKTGMGDKSGEGFAQKRNFILSKTASTSCVPSVKNMAPNNFGLMKTASTSDVPFYRLSAIGASDGILKEAEDEQLSKDRNSSGKGEPVGSLYGDSKVKQGDVDLLNKTSEADATCKKTQNLLSPVKAKHNDIMLDSESMSSNSTLNELEIDAIADRISSNPSGKHSSPAKLSGVSAGGKSERVNAVLPIIEVQYDKDADDFSGSEWAHEELASTFEDDFSDEFNQNPFVTVRDRRKKNLRRFSWEDDEPAVPVQNNKLFHTAFVQSIVLDDDFDVTPPNGIDFEEMAENEPAYSSNTLSRSSGRLSADQSVKSSEKSVDTNSLLSNGASDENLLNNCDKKLSESTPLISSNDEFGAGERKNDDSSDSTYKTPDSTTKYKGYTGNFARKVSPFGSILDSVIRRRENLESNGRTATVKENEKPVPSKVDESAENDKNLKTEQAGVLKKLNVEPFVKNDKKIYRRKSINGDTPKNSAEEDMFYTPMTSRKGTPDQRPWSVCGTPTETRKVIVTTGNATPTNAGYTKDFRFLTTVEREKRREQARQRARLKSDEELGILPSNYSRRKYRNRTGSLSEEPEAVAEQDSIGDLHRETTFNSDALETSHISLGSLGEFKSHENLREPIDETICDMQAINHGGADVHEVVNKNSDLEANQNCVGSCGVEDLKPDEVASLDVDSGGINTKMADVASNSSDSMRENDSPELTTGKIADSKIEGDSLLPSVAMNENIGVEQENAGCKKTEACHLSDIKSGECAAQMTNSVSSLMSSSVSDQDCGKQAPKTPNTSLGSLAEIKSDGANDGSRSNTLDGD
ncbi:MICAL3 (predicted), partial [Pycnogonum litorale]